MGDHCVLLVWRRMSGWSVWLSSVCCVDGVVG